MLIVVIIAFTIKKMAVTTVSIQEFMQLATKYPVFDTRSEGEYAYAHIPGAYSLPIFNNNERAKIGTIYKQKSRKSAIRTGLNYFGKNLNNYIQQVEQILDNLNIDNTKPILVHCWRGGMRSNAMAWLLSFYGFDVVLLNGGYKAYRNWVLTQLALPFKFNALGGLTGSGKTSALRKLADSLPVIDLEALASHKGSAFGALNMPEQPSQEFFENKLVQALQPYYSINEQGLLVQPKTIWIENESQRIGNLNLTNAFYQTLLNAKLYITDVSFNVRLKNIINEYGNIDKSQLLEAIKRIQKRLGGLATSQAINALQQQHIETCFTILLNYYDKAYYKAWERNKRQHTNIKAETIEEIVNYILHEPTC